MKADTSEAQRHAATQPRGAIGWVWRDYMRQGRWMLAVALVLMMVEGAMIGALSYLIRPMFDTVFVGGNRDAVLWVALAVAGVFLLRAGAGFGHRWLMAAVGERFVARLQTGLLRHLTSLDPAFYQAHSPGNLIERVRGDTATLRSLWTSVFAAFGRDLVTLLALLAVAVSIDWLWTLVAISGAPLVLLPVLILQRLVRRTSRAARASAATLSTRLDEIFHGITTIQLTGNEARETQRFRDTQDQYLKVQLRAEAGSAGIPALIDVVAGLGFAAVLSYGGLQIIDGEKTIGEFMSFFTAIALIFDPLRRLGAVSGAWQVALSSLERIRSVFDTAPTILSPDQPLPAPRGAGVTLRDVEFSYGRDPVLQGITLRAEPGQTTAIVGRSGAGKSTIFGLLTRLSDPDAGQVMLGETDLRDIGLDDLRAQFSVVSQETALFDETIRDNILMGHADVSDSRMQAVLRDANLADFVANLPLGLDTAAGPRGSGLSGGQRQRVAIARALLRNAPILLLDEATSALDAQSEALVQEALDRLSEGRTTLVIAHRLATVRNADKIIVLERGRVVEEGTHEALLERGGLYADLCRLQFAQ